MSVDARIQELEQQLQAEKDKNSHLTGELAKTKEDVQKLIQKAEQEEELIANQLLKRLNDLKQEKAALVLELEQEEEYLTNTLQKKLEQMQKEKFRIEQELEKEEELVANKLMKQITEITEERDALELALEKETERVTQLKSEIEQLRCKQLVSNSSACSQCQIYRKTIEKLRSQVRGLNSEIFVLKQRVNSNTEQLHEITLEKVRLQADMECQSEREFNTQTRSVSRRARSVSLPVNQQNEGKLGPLSPKSRESPSSSPPARSTPMEIGRKNSGPRPNPLLSGLSPETRSIGFLSTSPSKAISIPTMLSGSPRSPPMAMSASPINSFLSMADTATSIGGSTLKQGWMKKEIHGHWAPCMMILNDSGVLVCCNSESAETISINLDTVLHVENVSGKTWEKGGSYPNNTMELQCTTDNHILSCDRKVDFQEWVELIKDLSPICV